MGTATDHACPTPPLQSYTEVGRPATFDALCTGTADFNSFYGDGIVNALGVVADSHHGRTPLTLPEGTTGMPSAHPSGRHTLLPPALVPSWVAQAVAVVPSLGAQPWSLGRTVSRRRAPSPSQAAPDARGLGTVRRSPRRAWWRSSAMASQISRARVEKVVRAPQNPMPTSASGALPTPAPTRTPSTNEPATFTTRVPAAGVPPKRAADAVVDQVAQRGADGGTEGDEQGGGQASWPGPDPLSENRTGRHGERAERGRSPPRRPGPTWRAGRRRRGARRRRRGPRRWSSRRARRRPRRGGPAGAPRGGRPGRRPAAPSRRRR